MMRDDEQIAARYRRNPWPNHPTLYRELCDYLEDVRRNPPGRAIAERNSSRRARKDVEDEPT